MDELTPTPEQRRELLKLHSKATPLPWNLYRCGPESDDLERLILTNNDHEDEICGPFLCEADAEYAHSAANLAPGLVREVERYQKALEELQAKSRDYIDRGWMIDTRWVENTAKAALAAGKERTNG